MAGATDTLTGRRENARIEPDWYSICGLPVRSEVVLPLPPARPPEGTTPAWTIRYGEAAQRLKKPRWNWPAIPQSGRPVATSPDDGTTTFYHHIQKGADGVWFWWDGLATAHVSPDARDVAVYLDSDPDERLLGLLLAGPFAAVIFGQLGYPTLHASAIATPAGAVVFLGRKGQGKSTMAAAFLRRGDALLTDDMLLLRAESDGVCGVPGPPHMKLWRPTAEHTLGLAVDSLPNVVGTMEKKLLWIDGEYSMTRQPARIRALYVLDRYEPQSGQGHQVSSREVTGVSAITTVLAQTYGPLLTTSTAAAFLPIVARLVKQAHVRVLRYPTGYEWQESACRLVLDQVTGQ